MSEEPAATGANASKTYRDEPIPAAADFLKIIGAKASMKNVAPEEAFDNTRNETDAGAYAAAAIADNFFADELVPAAAAGTATPARIPAPADEPVPRKYREMMKIAAHAGRTSAWEGSDAAVFCMQGKFMAEFEDFYAERAEFTQYFPTYQSMTARQLRAYFSWRTKVRRNIFEPASLSYAFVYMFELINQIGVESPEEGFAALQNFCKNYRALDTKIDRYSEAWLRDYVVYYNLDKALLGGAATKSQFDSAMEAALDCGARGDDEVFAAANYLSSYNMENSGLFKRRPDDVKPVVRNVFVKMMELSGRGNGRGNGGADRGIFGRAVSASHQMFRSAVFFDRKKYKDYSYEVSGVCKYRCENSIWRCEWLMRSNEAAQRFGAVMKGIDALMRQKYSFKPALKFGKLDSAHLEIIRREIENHLERKRIAALQKAMPKIDISKLEEIRVAALETQSKLIVEEENGMGNGEWGMEREETEPRMGANGHGCEMGVTQEAQGNNSAGLDAANLSEFECQFLRILLNGETRAAEFAKSTGMPLSVVVDAINEKLFDLFGDTVVVCDGRGRGAELVEDYTLNVEKLFGGEA